MSAGLLKPSVADKDKIHMKLRLRQQRQARYYKRGARDLDLLERGDVVGFQPWQAGKKEWQKGVVKNLLSERSYEVELPHGVLRRNRIHLRKINGPAAMTNPTQPEQCNKPQCQKPQPQEPVETEASELPVEVPNEVPLPATPQAPEPRRS